MNPDSNAGYLMVMDPDLWPYLNPRLLVFEFDDAEKKMIHILIEMVR